jgi:nucleoside 2-deoxyribosyltransferase
VVRDLEEWGRVQFTPDDLMRRSFALIDASDLVVVDLTEKGVGVGIEAGYAFAHGLPVVTVAEVGADISTTLRGISRAVLRYRTPDDLVEPLVRLRGQGLHDD